MLSLILFKLPFISLVLSQPHRNLSDSLQIFKKSNRILNFQSNSKGTDRSSIFVAMSILVQQLRLEKKVDICTVVRKLRSQRPQMIDSYVSLLFYNLWTFLQSSLFAKKNMQRVKIEIYQYFSMGIHELTNKFYL